MGLKSTGLDWIGLECMGLNGWRNRLRVCLKNMTILIIMSVKLTMKK